MKKLLALLLTVLMIISVIPLTAFADEAKATKQEELPAQTAESPNQGTTSGTCGKNLTWSYNATTATLTISGSGDMYDFSLGECYD